MAASRCRSEYAHEERYAEAGWWLLSRSALVIGCDLLFLWLIDRLLVLLGTTTLYDGWKYWLTADINTTSQAKLWSNVMKKKNAASAWMNSIIQWHCLVAINFAPNA